MNRNASFADQLAGLKPAPIAEGTTAVVIPLPVRPTRRDAQRAAIEAVPIIRRHPRTLERFRLKLDPPRQSPRPRTTFRRTKAAAPALLVRDFELYNDALEYSRSIDGHKPLRMLDGPSLYWRIVSPNLKPHAAEWVNAGPWSSPSRYYCDTSTIAEILDAIPDFSQA